MRSASDNPPVSLAPAARPRRFRVRGWLPTLILLCCVGALGAFRGSHPGGDISWAVSYDAGLRQAQQTGKPLLLSFHTPGCGWCEKLDAETFTDPQVVELSRRFVCVRLDSDVDGPLALKYGIMEYPQTVFASPKGVALAHLPGYVPPDRFAPVLRAVLHAH